MATVFGKDMVFLILQYLSDEKYQETVHKIEQESGFFFNMKYFEEKVLAADWDEVEKYLSGFTNVVDNIYSTRLFLEIRKQKYFEALDRHDKAKVAEIVEKGLKMFSTIDENQYTDAVQLRILENLWDDKMLAECGDTTTHQTRTHQTVLLKALKRLIEVNPAFQDKLVFPTIEPQRLQTLINQSLNWQHLPCDEPNPHTETLFTNHVCTPTNRAHAAIPVTLPVGAAANPAAYCPFPPTANASNTNALAGRMTNATVSSSARIEQESGFYFYMKYFEEKVLAADWDEVEKYLSGFTNVADNIYSARLFYEIRKQMYYEARNMDNELLAECGDTIARRTVVLNALKTLIEVNPAFRDKLVFPTIEPQRLQTLINQSHMCTPTNRAHAATPVTLPVGAAANPAAYCPSPPTATAANANALAGRITNTTVSSAARPALVNTSSIPVLPNQVPILKRPRTPTLTYYPNNDHEQGMRQLDAAAQPTINKKQKDPTVRKSRTLEDSPDEGKLKELTKIVDPSKCQVVTMPASKDPVTTGFANKVARLLYTNSGNGILALGSNGIQKLWKWSRTAQNPSGKATASVVPQPWQPEGGLYMTNDVSKVNLQEAVPCIALSNNDSFVISSCGGVVSLFVMMHFKVIARFMAPPPAPTFLAVHPQDNNILAIGMEDATIHIYNVNTDWVKSKLKGHQKRITGLAFSTNLNILVSSGADNQLCTWNAGTWEKGNTITIQVPAGKVVTGQTQIHFHSDQVRLLVFCETQLAIYDASKMERIQRWVPGGVLSAPVSCAAYSCNSQVVYAAFYDGSIGVFDAESLRLRCCIAPAAYLSPAALNNSQNVGPLVIATHPEEPNQFSIGMTDGTVKVLEPSGSDGWCVEVAPSENGTTTPSVGTSDREPD